MKRLSRPGENLIRRKAQAWSTVPEVRGRTGFHLGHHSPVTLNTGITGEFKWEQGYICGKVLGFDFA